MSTFLVNAGGVILMAAIVWWFWLSPSGNRETNQDHSHHH
jgi:plastocyanin domain-containing protein